MDSISRLFAFGEIKMIIIAQQSLIQIFKDKNKCIEIVQSSFELGCDVKILIQPENVEKFCLALMEESKKDVIK